MVHWLFVYEEIYPTVSPKFEILLGAAYVRSACLRCWRSNYSIVARSFPPPAFVLQVRTVGSIIGANMSSIKPLIRNPAHSLARH